MTRICYIMRGAPGTGKTTYAEKIIRQLDRPMEQGVICSNDHYKDYNNGRRPTEEEKQSARDQCMHLFLAMLHRQGGPPQVIVVDNTNSTVAEIAPYERLARLYGYETQIVQMVCRSRTAHKRNRHNVSLNRVVDFAVTIKNERLPHYWKVVKVLTDPEGHF